MFGQNPLNPDVGRSKRKQWVMAKRVVESSDDDEGDDEEKSVLRFEEEADWSKDVVDQVTASLENLTVLHEEHHTCDGVALLCAEKDAPRQHSHADMKSRKNKHDKFFSLVTAYDGCTPFPLSVMIATSPGGAKLWTPEGEIFVPQFGCVVFRGDLIHAGSAYDEVNFRIHLYFGYMRTFPESGKTFVRSVPTSGNKRGNERDTVIITKKKTENNSFFDTRGEGRKRYESAYPHMKWRG